MKSRNSFFALKTLFLVLSASLLQFFATAQGNTTFESGSYIVNMGSHANVVATDISHELKPYGMVYDLLKNYSIPVNVVINQSKAKDGVDFTYNGVSYKGGTLVIDKKYISSSVASRISYWNTQGVLGNYTNSSLTLNVTLTYNSVPTWTLDAQNGSIATGFFTNAGIPSSCYNWLAPSQLGACSDIFVMPHADPTWATHGNLYNWNLTYKGAIWLGCHASSALENMYNPSNTTQQTNFLTTKATSSGSGITLPSSGSTSYAQNSLILWGNHSNATIPYNTLSGTIASGTLATAADPVAQFIGTTDAAHLNGSEQVYLPVLGQGWRSSTKIITYDPTQANVPTNSAGPAVIMAYGKGFGDNNRGYVMMEAGHSINKGTSGDVAAQRAFFNWSFLSTADKASIKIDSISGIPADRNISSTTPLNIIARYTLQTGVTNVNFTWSCVRTDNGTSFGSFVPNGTTASANTIFTPSAVSNPINVVITLKMTDACGRQSFQSIPVTVNPGNRAPIANPDNESIPTTCYTQGVSKMINVLSNDSDPDNNTLTVTSVSGNNGTWTTNGTTVTFTPSANFFGTATATYTVCDNSSSCVTSSISVGVGTADGNGCFPGSVYDVANSIYSASQTNTSVTNGDNATGEADYDATDNTTYAVLDNNSDALILNFGSLQSASNYDSVVVYLASQTDGTNVTASFSYSTNGSSYTSLGSFATSSGDDAADAHFKMPASGLQYLKIQRTAGSPQLRIDAASLENWGCVAAIVVANEDEQTVTEDITSIIDVVSNDGNPGDLPLKLKVVKNPVHGIVSVNTDNTISYVSTENYPPNSNGSDSIEYQICNNLGYCSTGKVYLTITDDGCGSGQYKPLNSNTTTTVTIQGTTSNMIDSYIKKDKTSENKGSDAKLELGKKTSSERRDLFQFNTINTIPSNAVIQSAVFSIYKEGGDNYALNLAVYRLTQSWTESGVTWDKRDGSTSWTTSGGTYTSTPIASANTTYANGYKDFNVTSLVQSWVNGTYSNYGMLVKQTTTSSEYDKKYYITASEGSSSNTPKLVITYLTPGSCITIPNRNPFANPDDTATVVGFSIEINSLLNDKDPEANSISISNATCLTSSTGTVLIVNNKVKYTPNGARSVPRVDTLIYTITDGSLTDQAYIFVNVGSAKPNLVTDYSSNNSGVQQTINVATNDSDPQSLSLTNPTIVGESQNGSFTLNGTNVVYTPNQGFYGKDTMIYERCQTIASGCNPIGLCDTAYIIITVNNQAPTATDKNLSTYACQEKTFSLKDNISDPENETLTIDFVSGPSHGSLIPNNDGSFTYTPTPGFPGIPGIKNDTINYKVTDPGTLFSSTHKIIIEVNGTPANISPVALDDIYDSASATNVGSINEDLYVDVLSNDSDADGNFLNIQITSAPNASGLLQPLHGTVRVFNGQLLYKPNFNFLGVDSFEYALYDSMPAPENQDCPGHVRKYDVAVVTVMIYPGPLVEISGTVWNDINGSAANTFDNIYSTSENGTNISNTLYVYCSDSTGKIIDYSTVNPDGTYKLAGVPSNRSDLKLTLTSISAQVGDDEPNAVIDNNVWTNTSPLIRTSFVTTNLFVKDIDWGVEELPTPIAADPITDMSNPGGFSNLTVPSNKFNGTDPSNGIIDSIVITDFPSGVNSITIDNIIYINGGFCPPSTNCINWTGKVTIPTNSLGNPTKTIKVDPLDGSKKIKIPFKNIDNANKSSLIADTVFIDLINNIPLAEDDTISTNENDIINGSVCANDSSSKDGGNTWAKTEDPKHGTLILNNDCTYTYTPDSNYNGLDTFYYKLCDIDGDCDTAMVVITINCVKTVAPSVDLVQPNCTVATGKITITNPLRARLLYSIDETNYQASNVFDNVSTGSYNVTVKNASCISDVSVTVIDKQPLPNTGDTTAFACNTFSWYGTEYTESTEPTYTFTNASGCDSVVTLHLTVGHANTGDTTAFACNTFSWYGTEYTESAEPTYTFTNASGCDSVVTLHLTVGHANTGDTTAFACNTFSWYGTEYTESAEPTYTFTNASGCDSVVTLHLTVGHANTGDTTAFACNTFSWYGTEYTESAEPTYTFTNASGCDSVVTLHLTVGHANNGDTTAFACNSFNWYGTEYTESAEPTYTFTNASGCDSVVTLHLTVGHANTGDTTAFACNSFNWYGTEYTESAEPTHTFTNASGCDSVVTLHLTVGHANTGDTTAFACNSFNWYGTEYTESAEPTHTFTNASGCDSVVTLHLTVGHANSGDTTVIACNSFNWYGTEYTESAEPTYTFTNASGCDSVVTLHLTISTNSTKPTVNISQPTCSGTTGSIEITSPIGSGYTYSIDGTTYQSSTTFNTLLDSTYHVSSKNSNGCVSPDTSVIIKGQPKPTTRDTAASACDSYNWHGRSYTLSGVYRDTLTVKNQYGCDSIVILTLTINPKPSAPVVNIKQPTCGCSFSTSVSITVTSPVGAGFTYSINGSTYQSSTVFSNLTPGTTYYVTAKNNNGCVSSQTSASINQNPVVPSAPTVSLTQPTCSVSTGTITVTAPTGTGYTYSINGTSFQAGMVFNTITPGCYKVYVKSADGCVSKYTTVTINSAPTKPNAPTVSITQPTCSVATGTITVSAPTGTGYKYSINGTTYQTGTCFSGLAAGTYSVTAKNAAGCISNSTTATINIAPTKPNAPSISLTQPTCSVSTGTITVSAPTGTGYTYSINGSTYQSGTSFSGVAAGTYSVTVKNASGCVSTATTAILTAVTTPAAPTVTLTQPTCSVSTGTITVTAPTGTGYTYSINGSTYQSGTSFTGVAAGTYSVTVKNGSGCVSTATTAILTAVTTPAAPTVTLTQSTCNVTTGTITITAPTGTGFTYSINGSTYQCGTSFTGVAAGTYSVTVKNASGCVSTATTAVLTAVTTPAAPTVTLTQSTCNVTTGTITITAPTGTGFTYSINGSTYQCGTSFTGVAAGTYSVTVKNASGCVSTATTAVLTAVTTPAAPSVTLTQPTCSVSTGAIIVTAPTGTGYTYSINGSTYQSGTSFTGVAAGTYSVTVKNGSSCVSTATTAVLTSVTASSAPTVSTTQPTCSITTGTITITAPTGTGYTYSINGSTYQSGTSFTGVTTGTYSVTVKNGSGCVSTATTAVLTAASNCNLTAGIYHTTTACSNYLNGTGQKATSLCYTVCNGKISNVTPGQFFYYTSITAPSSSFTVDIVQTNSIAAYGYFAIQQTDQATLWNSSCTKVATGTSISTGQGRVSISNAVVGAKYVLSVKYNCKSIIGATCSNSSANCTFSFASKINNSVVSNSQTSITMTTSCSTSTVARASSVINGDAVSKASSNSTSVYPNPTNTTFKLKLGSSLIEKTYINIMDLQGRLINKLSTNNLGNIEFGKDLKKGMYFVEIIQGENRKTIKVEKE